MQKWFPKSDQNGLQKGPQKWAKITKMGSKSHPKTVFKKKSKNYDFQHPQMWLKCCKYKQKQWISAFVVDPLLGLILEVFWEPKWRLRPSKSHLKKNIKEMMPKMTPKWSQRGSQNGAKIVKNEVLEASCFKGGSQEASRPPLGSILERCWDHFGTIFVNLSTIFLLFFVSIL